eukprot:1759418-Rhodomonas_salina.1
MQASCGWSKRQGVAAKHERTLDGAMGQENDLLVIAAIVDHNVALLVVHDPPILAKQRLHAFRLTHDPIRGCRPEDKLLRTACASAKPPVVWCAAQCVWMLAFPQQELQVRLPAEKATHREGA